MRILIVEDEKKIANFIKKGLEAEGWAVDLAFDGPSGLQKGKRDSYDLIILDVMLPQTDGLEICKRLRDKKVSTPILMLTAKDSTEDKIEGLDRGADDYLTKPFAFEELLARIRSLLRRQGEQPKKNIIKVGPLTIDLKKHIVRCDQKEVALSAKEFALLEYLARHAGEIVTRTQILEHVWDQNYDPLTNITDVYIRYLRRKLKPKNCLKLIETIRGVGYRLRK